jgi:hypothetical protein
MAVMVAVVITDFNRYVLMHRGLVGASGVQVCRGLAVHLERIQKTRMKKQEHFQ